jgi:hypothetical protein
MAVRLRSLFVLIIVAILATAEAVSHPAPSQTVEPDPPPIHIRSKKALVTEIGKCLSTNKEVLLFDDHVNCMPYRAAGRLLHDGKSAIPLSLTFTKYCPPASPHSGSADSTDAPPFTARVLTSSVISELAHANVGSYGIRILGAVFCDKLEIVGLSLPFSLILDHSLFREGIEIRNLDIRGDLSFDGSLVFKQLKILRSHIDGSLYGDRAFIDKLEVSNSSVAGSASFSESVLFHSTQFDDAVIARELSVRASALARLWPIWITRGRAHLRGK